MKDATSLYRAVGPLSRLKRTEPDIAVFSTNQYDWASIALTADVMFMQRPFSKDHVRLMEMVKNQNIPVIVDYDDDLFSVPSSNPTHYIYGKEETKKNVFQCLSMCDQVWVSTQHLKRKIESLNIKAEVMVVPNALNFKMFSKGYVLRDEPQNGLVMWRGSKTHDADILKFLPQITALVEKHQKYVFHFQGGMPWFLERSLSKFKNVTTGNGVDPIEYFDMLTKLRPSLFIVPLEDTEFNRAKSNIAWIEGTYAGAATLCPNWEEWNKKGALNYDSEQDFFTKADEFLSKETDPRQLNERSWNEVIANYELDRVNKLRYNSIKKLYEGA